MWCGDVAAWRCLSVVEGAWASCCRASRRTASNPGWWCLFDCWGSAAPGKTRAATSPFQKMAQDIAELPGELLYCQLQ
ncbi:hypothetical protein O3P69_000287 [Scylla paramamosain]|uniref:Secreted protein n=1 Tax=Scylla paramamosain TaxID=85552 RepID=A0AAW0UVE6_SCYPA